MSKISKADIALSSLAEAVTTLLSEWHPESFRTENQYSDALAEYLRISLPSDARVEREYRHEGTTADLCILYKGFLFEDRLLFELKRNLQRKSECDRLVGQIESLKPDTYGVIVVLVGDTDASLLGRLRDHYRDRLGGGFGNAFDIVAVP